MRIALLIMLLGWVGCAHAETTATCQGYIDTVPAVIDTQGTWCLDHDVATATATGAAITVNTNNVTIDCNGFKVGGLGAGPDTQSSGVFANLQLNTVVRNCTLRGFRFGVAVLQSGGALLERNRIESSTLVGIYLHGATGAIRDNQVIGVGPTAGASAWGIVTDGAIDVIGNTVASVVPDTAVGTALLGYGIQLGNNTGSRVRANIVRDIRDGLGGSVGILVQDTSQRVVLQDNDVLYGGTGAGSFGIACPGRTPLAGAVGNSMLGHKFPLLGCADAGHNLLVPMP